MKRKLSILFLALCLGSLVGCQKKTENAVINTDKEVETEQNTISEPDKQIDDTSSEDGKVIESEEASVDKKDEYVYKPTIEQPEKLFETIEQTKAFKAIGYHNPIMTQRFGADPFAMVYGDRVYVYSTNDSQQLTFDSNGKALDNTYGKINTLNCISSDDLVNWTDHGVIRVGKPGGATLWANNSWAPAATYKEIDGKDQFFLYFANSGGGIGVLRSDSPIGPFEDPLGKALITKQTENCFDVLWLFDPAVLLDDDGKAYLYFGGGVPQGKEEMPNTARVVELGDDMISLAGAPVVIEAPYIFEDSGINKIGDTYYYTYCANWSSRDNAVGPYKPGAAEIIYMTSDKPMGPWEYQGSILQNPGRFFGSWGNNHHSMVKFKDQFYMFYHTQLLQDNMGIRGGYRSIHVDEVTINEDGSIKSIIPTKFGVKQIKNLDPYNKTEAETIAWMGGISTMKVDEASNNLGMINNVITDIHTGDWIGLSNVDFGDTVPKAFQAKVSSETAGNLIRITVDSVGGECLGYLEVPDTGNASEYVEVTVNISGVTGVHNLFFTFSGEGFQFDSWRFVR